MINSDSQIRVRQISESAFTVQGHGVHTAFLETTESLRARRDVAVRTNRRGNFDVTHIHTVGLYSLWYLLFGSGKKVVSAHVVPDSFVGSLVAARLWLPLARIYLKWFYNRAAVVLAVSDSTKRQLRKIGVHRPIKVVYNTIDTARYQSSSELRQAARQALKIAPDAQVVIGAGQVQPRKRVDVFVQLAKKHPGIQFIWVGGMPFGALASDHAKMSKMMGRPTSNLKFTDTVPFDQMKQYYQAADVFLLPSEQETFGLVVVEAAAAGLPVVLRDIPDYYETFGDDALLSDDTGFDLAIKGLLSDQKLYEKYRGKARSIAERYDSRTGAERLTSIYRSLL